MKAFFRKARRPPRYYLVRETSAVTVTKKGQSLLDAVVNYLVILALLALVFAWA